MLTDKTRVPADTSRITLAEDWEVRWWCDRYGCTEVALRRAVEDAGPSAAEVERHLREAGKVAFKNAGED